MIRNSLLVVGALSIVGCGGGGGSTVTQSPYSAVVKKAFSDGAGIARIRDTSSNETAYYLGPIVTDLVAAYNAGTDASGVEFSDFPVTDTTSYTYANVRSGTVTASGITANITVLEDKTASTGIVYIEFPSAADLVFTSGTALGSLPSGTFTYNGTYGISPRSVIGSNSVGTFSMSADFTNGLATFNGTTTSTASSLTGSNIPINLSSGEFAATNLNLTYGGSYSGTATMYGSFNGANAEGVSGVFSSNESNPTYAGAFAGSR